MMDCKLLDCDRAASARVISPFGTVNLCTSHAMLVMDVYNVRDWEAPRTPEEQAVLQKLLVACRYGPGLDPPLEAEGRGPEFARPDANAEPLG